MVQPVREAWRVRIRSAEGRIYGAGVLIDGSRILTCAHVVADALATDPYGGRPIGAVTVDFPSLSGVTRMATVMPGAWVPLTRDGRGDVAVLVLDEAVPDDLQPATFRWCGGLDGREVRAYGHPSESSDGVWAKGRLTGSGGPGGEWIQLDGLATVGYRVKRGFSGAGVFDERSLAVVGVVVAEDRKATHRVAWMVPVEQVVAYLPNVSLQVGDGGKAVESPMPRSAVEPERRLSLDEREQLVDKLAAVPGMLDRPTRDLYLRVLQDEIGVKLSSDRQADDRLDVWALTYPLLEQPGALRTFVTVLGRMNPDSQAVAPLEEFVERRFPDLLLERAERLRLESLLDGVASSLVRAAQRTAVPPLSGSYPGGADVVSVIRHLEGFGRLGSGPPPPLLAFVEHLAHKMGGTTSANLHRWIDAVGDRLQLPRTELERLCDEAEKRRSEIDQAFIVVQLQPHSYDTDRYLMSVWLEEGHRGERLLLRDDVARTLQEVGEQFDAVLLSISEQVSDFAEFTVEFILPRELIGHPVDEFEFDRARFPRPLGIRYPVVVRSLERLRNRLVHDIWRRKWRALADEGHRADALPISYVRDGRSRDPRVLYSSLIADDRRVCLAVPFPPSNGGDVARNDEFIAGLEAGMPAIVWSREPVDTALFEELVQGDLMCEGVVNLPRRMLWLRRKAMTTMDGTQPSRSLPSMSLLWDDADRVPGPFRRPVRLQPPPLGDGG